MSVVFTIGYEGTDIERFVSTLKTVGIAVVADVRAVAISRKKGFSKTILRDRLALSGIDYVHLGELGDPKPGRDAARAGRYDEFRKIYLQHLKGAAAIHALDTLDKTVRAGPTCMLCFERDPATCHRSLIADKLKVRGLEVFNLYGDEPNRYVQSKCSDHHFS